MATEHNIRRSARYVNSRRPARRGVQRLRRPISRALDLIAVAAGDVSVLATIRSAAPRSSWQAIVAELGAIADAAVAHSGDLIDLTIERQDPALGQRAVRAHRIAVRLAELWERLPAPEGTQAEGEVPL